MAGTPYRITIRLLESGRSHVAFDTVAATGQHIHVFGVADNDNPLWVKMRNFQAAVLAYDPVIAARTRELARQAVRSQLGEGRQKEEKG